MTSTTLVLDDIGIHYSQPPVGLKYTPNDIGLSWNEMNHECELQVGILAW